MLSIIKHGPAPLRAKSNLTRFSLAASTFGAKSYAPKRGSAAQCPLFASGGGVLLPGQTSLASLTTKSTQPNLRDDLTGKHRPSTLVFICRQRRHLSTSFPTRSTMDHFANSNLHSGDSRASSESDPAELSLSESGHKQFQAPNLVDCNFLKAPLEKKVYRIVVEGNIGSGKTTFLNIFAKHCAFMRNKPLIVPEPVDLWRNVGGQNVFQLLADDPKRWSFAFQSYVQHTMIQIHKMQPDDGNFKVMERSLFSARYCFVQNLINKGLLQPCEFFILDEGFKANLSSVQVDLIIYLKSDPDVVFDRIKMRARPEEAGITLEYLRTLHELHEDWLERGKFPLPAPVLTIDANTPLDQIVAVYKEKADDILRDYALAAI